MNELINQIISAVLQILVFALIPFIFFLFRRDKRVSFFQYIGLYKASGKSVLYVLIAAMLLLIAGIGMVFIDEGVRQAVLAPVSVTGHLRQMGLSATTLMTLLVMALLKTSLSEEIFFRGFIARQLIDKIGFRFGNILQAAIFGLVHLLLFWKFAGTGGLSLILILVFSTAAGWIIGYIKHKHANGSIVPGWIAHGLGNTLSYYFLAFVL